MRPAGVCTCCSGPDLLWLLWLSEQPMLARFCLPLTASLRSRLQAPYLEDPNTGKAMFESASIIQYLQARLDRHWHSLLPLCCCCPSSAAVARQLLSPSCCCCGLTAASGCCCCCCRTRMLCKL
jgi:hypothetical protein